MSAMPFAPPPRRCSRPHPAAPRSPRCGSSASGCVLLVQRLTGWPWTEAWPLFVILVGVASLVSVLLGWRAARSLAVRAGLAAVPDGRRRAPAHEHHGRAGRGCGGLVSRWWPVALIAFGLWFLLFAAWPGGRPSSDGNRVSIPLAGTPDASIRLRFGGGELTAGPAPRGILLDGEFEAAAARTRERTRPLGARARVANDMAMVGANAALADRPDHRGAAGAAAGDRRREDPAGTRVRRSCAGFASILAPATRGSGCQQAAGETFVRAEAGAAGLTLEVPLGVAARVHSQMVLGSTDVDPRFPRTADGWESPDWRSAANRVEIEIRGGIGSARVVAA